jgi:hypothetical protein
MIDIDVSKIISEIGEPKARLIQNEDEKRQKKYIKIFSFAFLILFIIGTIVFYFLSTNETALATSLTADVDGITKANTALAQVENKAIFIQNRNADLLKIIQSNPTWSYVFETLENVVPKNITFTRFEVQSPAIMRIAGTSPDYETLSKLVVSMNNFTSPTGDAKSSVFGNVEVTNASLVTVAERTMVEFTISFSFVKKINKESVNPVAEVNPTQNVPTNQGFNMIPTPAPTPTPTTPPTVPTTPTTSTPTPTVPVTPPPAPGNSGLPTL